MAFPLGVLTSVTGVSGSGKSTLVNDILATVLANQLNGARQVPGRHTRVTGLDQVDKLVRVDQSPIGRTPRSNPATYTGVFDKIRTLFAATTEAKVRGYQPGRFSFNVKGGRCEACSGDGTIKIEMNFLPDVYVPCEVCHGARYNRETLEVHYKGKTIAEVLDMPIEEAAEFFEPITAIHRYLQTLVDVGLGYVRLGQPAPTLSGGEAQRVKLASELQKRSTGRTVYILDEPTTGLHFEDIRKLLGVINGLVDKGNTVIVIEHNLDVIKTSDWIIDMGPEGGAGGGTVVAEGTPEQVARMPESYTGQFLAEMLGGMPHRPARHGARLGGERSRPEVIGGPAPCTWSTRYRLGKFGGGLRQGRGKPRVDPHPVQPCGELVGPSLQCSGASPADVRQEPQLHASRRCPDTSRRRPGRPTTPSGRHCRLCRKLAAVFAQIPVPVEPAHGRDVQTRQQCGPRWTSGSGPGRRAARSRLPPRSTATASNRRALSRTAVTVVPNHHLISSTVAGPNVRNQLRANSARAASTVSLCRPVPSQLADKCPAGPRHRPGSVIGSAHDIAAGTRAPSEPVVQRVRRPTVFPALDRRLPAARAAPLATRCAGRVRVREVAQHRRAPRSSQRVAVVGDTRFLHIGDQAAALVAGDPVACRRLNNRQVIGAHESTACDASRDA